MIEKYILFSIVLAAISGIPGLFLPSTRNWGQWLAVLLIFTAAILGIGSAVTVFTHGTGPGITIPWVFPIETIVLQSDPLSSAFLIPILFLSFLCSFFGLEYWKQSEHSSNGRKLSFFFGLMTAAAALLVIAQQIMVFLVAWEIMALSAFFVVTTESEKEEVREAGWIYLVATHTGTLFLFGYFALFSAFKGNMIWDAFAPSVLSAAQSGSLFLLALAGFGLKAGLIPLHVWLPSAHANAPSHVSAFLSGIFIKMGVYGVLRTCMLLPDPPQWWGILLLILGVVSGILGVVFAIGQHDLKRLLAYHSIENIGIIFMGIGLAMLGQSTHHPAWTALGLSGAILHVWNHGLFKALLFLSAGAVIHTVHTREIDRLGGLAKRMPATAFAFLLGAIAICGLPPLNGFISELLIYLGLFTLAAQPGDILLNLAVLAVPALALIGALALLCFVKAYSAVFLGEPRTVHAAHAKEAGWAMKLPMAVLSVLCLIIGLFPFLFVPVFDSLIENWTGVPNGTLSLSDRVPFGALSKIGFGLLLTAAAGFFFLRQAVQPTTEPVETWSCGYLGTSSRIQYTSSSFAQMIVDLCQWALKPIYHQPRVEGLFPSPACFHSHVSDTVFDRLVLPIFSWAVWASQSLRFLQQGQIQAYVLYIFVTLLLLLMLI